MRPEAGRGAEAQSVTVKSTSIPDSEVKYLFIFIFSFLRCVFFHSSHVNKYFTSSSGERTHNQSIL